MDYALVSLIAASIALVGTHFALSHQLRAPLVKRLGANGFMALYSITALACLYWMAQGFRAAPPASLGGSGAAGWIFASALTLVAVVLLFGSFRKNPALPAPGAADLAATRQPTGVFAVTRHPMMWSFAQFRISHYGGAGALISWRWRSSPSPCSARICRIERRPWPWAMHGNNGRPEPATGRA